MPKLSGKFVDQSDKISKEKTNENIATFGEYQEETWTPGTKL